MKSRMDCRSTSIEVTLFSTLKQGIQGLDNASHNGTLSGVIR